MSLSRRDLIKLAAASGALLVANPSDALARPGKRPPKISPDRRSKLFPRSGLRLVHADLHNHTLLSDGDGQAEDAFASMRAAGLDVAAITDHSGTGKLLGETCQGCEAALGIDEGEWRRLGELAQAANDDGSFVALRGFEWSSPVLGHINVWASQTWTDPAATGGVGASATAATLLHEGNNPLPSGVESHVNELLRLLPDGEASMAGFYDWLKSPPDRPVLGGGADALAGFNHPGREAGRFGFFTFEPALRDRIVSLEMFNRNEDYLFEQVSGGAPSPLAECLDAGWRVGLLGVTDEHGTNWGNPLGKGRSGLWVRTIDREGVREAMQSRRFFSTRERGLRLDASFDGFPMGSVVDHRSGVVRFGLDIDKGPEWIGKTLRVQVLQTGRPVPTVVHETDVTVPHPEDEAIFFSAPISRDDGDWIVLRVTDPARPAAAGAAPFPAFAAAGHAVAYASPFFLGTT